MMSANMFSLQDQTPVNVKDKGSGKDSVSPGGNVVLQPELCGSEGKE